MFYIQYVTTKPSSMFAQTPRKLVLPSFLACLAQRLAITEIKYAIEKYFDNPKKNVGLQRNTGAYMQGSARLNGFAPEPATHWIRSCR
jgi:hypothetical protein